MKISNSCTIKFSKYLFQNVFYNQSLDFFFFFFNASYKSKTIFPPLKNKNFLFLADGFLLDGFLADGFGLEIKGSRGAVVLLTTLKWIHSFCFFFYYFIIFIVIIIQYLIQIFNSNIVHKCTMVSGYRNSYFGG